jgi:hypothetical protein
LFYYRAELDLRTSLPAKQKLVTIGKIRKPWTELYEVNSWRTRSITFCGSIRESILND